MGRRHFLVKSVCLLIAFDFTQLSLRTRTFTRTNQSYFCLPTSHFPTANVGRSAFSLSPFRTRGYFKNHVRGDVVRVCAALWGGIHRSSMWILRTSTRRTVRTNTPVHRKMRKIRVFKLWTLWTSVPSTRLRPVVGVSKQAWFSTYSTTIVQPVNRLKIYDFCLWKNIKIGKIIEKQDSLKISNYFLS